MITRTKKNLINLAEILHLRIFGHAISDEMRNFLSHLSWSMIGGIIASVILFFVNIFAGRYLGPEMYGKYNSTLSLASVLSVIFLLSLDTSSVRYLADKKYESIAKEIFTTIFIAVLFWGILVSLILIMLPNQILTNIFESITYLYWIIIFAFIISFKNLFIGFLRAFRKIKKQSVGRIIDASIVAIVFTFFLVKMKNTSYLNYVTATIAGGFVFVILSFYFLRNYYSKVKFYLLKKIFKEYSGFLLIGSVVGLILTGDKYIIGRLVGASELGYFSAYYTASHVVVAELSGIFMNAFWPTVIKNTNSLREIIRKADLLFILASPFWIFLILLSTLVFILLFGNDFPLRWNYVILFSINTFMGFLFSLWISFLNINHIKKAVLASSLFVILSVGILILTKSIIAYICTQIIIQILLVYLARIFLLKSSLYEK